MGLRHLTCIFFLFLSAAAQADNAAGESHLHGDFLGDGIGRHDGYGRIAAAFMR